jgi:RNA polymerase sigma factor (sigma-70 family)
MGTAAIRELGTLFHVGRIGDRSDGELLERFLSRTGPAADAAFTTLVERHGPLVLRICRRVLNDEHDAQDAFQATFLVLVRKAGSVRNRASVASWLHGVAHRVASRAKVEAARRRTHESRVPSTSSAPHDNSAEADIAVLDEEIRRLPEKYRAPIVLCYFEGLTQERAAEHLGWPAGTVRGRLTRARDLLRSRLLRRGLVAPAAALAAGITGKGASAAMLAPAVPSELLVSTVRASALVASGRIVADAAVAAIAKGTLRNTMVGKLGLAATAVLSLGILAAGAGVFAALSERDRAPLPKHDQADVPSPPLPAVAAPASLKVEPRDKSSDRPAVAEAPPLGGITIDGDLADWPRDRKRYPIQNLLLEHPNYGTGGLENADLTTSPDLSASFSVGYDLVRQLIYLAVEVRDDQLVVGNLGPLDTDAVEIYVDGLRSNRRMTGLPVGSWPATVDAAKTPAIQYVGIPGLGPAFGDKRGANPALMYGDITKTLTRMAYRREGDVTTYEWAIQAFDRYPDEPTRLTAGKRIGFDVVVVDRDTRAGLFDSAPARAKNRPAWIFWGPSPIEFKGFNAGLLGDLILLEPR